MPTERIEFLGLEFDRLAMNDVLERLSRVSADTSYSYVVTPNVDHVVRLNSPGEQAELAPLYQGAGLVLCDSRVLQRLARLHGLDLPLVPGSDLTVRLFNDIIRPGDRIAIIGGSNSLLGDLADRFPMIKFVQHLPPMKLRRDATARSQAVDYIESAKARFTFIAVGSPQQEMIAAELGKRAGAVGVALCIGASLDFITGRERRAPRFMQRLSLEWAFRLLADPRRMWRRYLVEGPRVFVLAARHKRDRPGK